MLETVFRTDDLPETDRFDCWCQLIRNSIFPSIMRPDHATKFSATSRLLDLTAVQVYTMSQTSVWFNRSGRLVRQSDPEQCQLILATHGRFGFAQDDLHTLLGAGDLMLCDSSRVFDGWVTPDENGAPAKQIVVQFPRAMLPRPALIHGITGRRLSGSRGMRTLISSYLRELVKPAAGYHSRDALSLGTATMDLVAALVTSQSHTEDQRAPEPRDRAMLHRILEFMRQRLGDPRLSPDMIAAAHHISTRYLHKLFQGQALSVAAWIRRQRLEHCHHDLADPRHHHRPIHAVAARWGFTDNAHFSRLFRSAYGISPSDYRRLAGRSARIGNSSTSAVNDFPAVL